MSPLWRDQVRIVLCPNRVILVRLRRGWRREIIDKQVVQCEPTDDANANWKSAMATFAAAVKEPRWQNADAVLILSNHFVRYLLVPWSDRVLSEEEQLALVRHHAAEIYGDTSATWEYRISTGGMDAPWVASGVERALLSESRVIISAAKLRLRSVQPYLMSAFNGWRHEFGRDTQWFVLMEEGSLCAMLLHRGQWHSVRLRRVGEDWLEQAELMLKRESLLNDLPGDIRKIRMHAPEKMSGVPAALDKCPIILLKPKLLPGLSQNQAGEYAMALAEVA